MSFDQFTGQSDATFCGNVRQSDQSRVWNVMQMDELPEVGVKRHKDSPFSLSPRQQRPIAGVGTQIASLDHVVSFAAKPVRQPPAGAAIDEKPHVFLTETAASVSPATTARAYALQARMSSGSKSG